MNNLINKLDFVRDILDSVSLEKTLDNYDLVIQCQKEAYKMLEDIIKELNNEININEWLVKEVKIKII